MNTKIKKIIAREFLWTLSSTIIFILTLLIWNKLHSKNLEEVQELESKIDKIVKFEPNSSLVKLYEKVISNGTDNLDGYIKDDSVLSKFDKKVILEYLATKYANKYKDIVELNSKFPEFGFDKNGFHRNFTKKQYEEYKIHLDKLENAKSSSFNPSISNSQVELLILSFLFFFFGIRYLFYATKWSIKQLKN